MQEGLDTREWDEFHNIMEYKLSIPSLNDFLLKTAGLINTSIKMRVQGRGMGSNGIMRGYYGDYARLRASTGRQTGFRDLTYSGKMFQALTETIIAPLSVKQYFMGAEAKKAEENDQRTPFFSYTEKEDEILDNELVDYFSFLN